MFLIINESFDSYTRKQLLEDDLAMWDDGCLKIFKFEGNKFYSMESEQKWVEVEEGS